MPGKTPFDAVVKKLRARALAYPETREDFPWGERAWKVKGKVFVFCWADPTRFRMSAKLPTTFTEMLRLPFVESTGYGLGKAGWVTARFTAKEKPPVAQLLAWVDESYRAVAPKSVLKTLDGAPARAASSERTRARPARRARSSR